MRASLLMVVAAFATLAAARAQEIKGGRPLADAWQQEYSAGDSQANHVIALWQFNQGHELEDSSGHGHSLEVAGADPIPEGKFGGGLKSRPGWPVDDKRHAAVAKAHPDLSPAGPFTIDMWMKPSAEMPDRGNSHLLCKKYVSHQDYQLILTSPEGKKRRLQLALGFGNDSEFFASDAADWPADAWQHIAVTYDGEGTVRFYRNGTTLGGRTALGRKSIAPGPLNLSIGDRTGSLYGGFAGVLDQVRISRGVREFSPVSLELTLARRAFVRFETPPTLKIALHNLQKTPLSEARVTLVGAGRTHSFSVANLAAGGRHELAVPFDTSLRPDVYDLVVRADVPGELPVHREESISVTLASRPLPHRMPVMMWGIGSPSEFAAELPRLKDLGFTQCLGFGADYGAIWKAGKPVVVDQPELAASTRAVREMLDTALANEFGIGATLYAGAFLKDQPELARVDRQGKPYARHDVNASLPGLVQFCENVGKSVGKTYGWHPAFVAALVNSEVRDDSEISFSEFDRAAYRQSSGQEIPDEITTKYGLSWKNLKDFPANRVIPDDDPRLRFLRWFWMDGDGWNSLHSALHRGLKSELPADRGVYTWFDPAIRTASVPGSGGEVDVISQWTYTEPSPLRLGYFADELFAMADLAAKPQRVMKMTQLFWYRSTSAPINHGAKHIASPFDDHDPDAAYISIAPMHLRGAFWTKLSRPVSGLMYHGWSSLVRTDGTHAYKFTQPDLQTEFKRLHREILPQIGPTLLQVTGRRSDVAYLDSFTAQMFARRGSFGYSNDEAYLTLLHAQLQPEVVFEDTVLRRGLDQYRILVLADCDVLPAAVARKVQEFQQRGGLIIGDPNLAPAIRPDVILPKFTRTKQAAADKATLLANAEQLRKSLDAKYQRLVETTTPEIVSQVRTAGTSDYVFTINDRREAGNYVGQHGLVLDIGLPSAGEVIYQPRRGAEGSQTSAAAKSRSVYDLVEQREVPAQVRDGVLRWPVTLGPCDGSVFLITERPIAQVMVELPETVQLGASCKTHVTVADMHNQAVDAVIPIRIDITDPHGRTAEYSGNYGAASGKLQLQLHIASNDAPGTWTLRARELASGKTATRFFRVVAP